MESDNEDISLNFLNVISKAKTACEVSGHNVPDHFPDVRKMVELGSGSQREISDMMLTRYACYLIAQNGGKEITPANCSSRAWLILQERMNIQTLIGQWLRP